MIPRTKTLFFFINKGKGHLFIDQKEKRERLEFDNPYEAKGRLVYELDEAHTFEFVHETEALKVVNEFLSNTPCAEVMGSFYESSQYSSLFKFEDYGGQQLSLGECARELYDHFSANPVK